MSYHILHLTTPNCSISVDRGFLFCKYKDGDTNAIPLLDLKAVIVIAQGICFTNHSLARLLENNVVILHCNNSYQPMGWSVPLDRIVRPKVFYNQIERNIDFENSLWKKLLKQKVINQAQCLDLSDNKVHDLYRLINKPLMNEANIARQYWKHYFNEIGNPIKREHMNAETFDNQCLNYGYAVIKTLVYRSIIVHGLIASLGIHHLGKYNSTPLVYDLMEPYRAFVDYYFYMFVQDNGYDYDNENFKEWAKYISEAIKKYRIKINDISYKIVDSIDLYIEKIVNAYLKFDCSDIFLPELKEQYLHIDNHRNREYEE